MASNDITIYYSPVSGPARSVIEFLDVIKNTSVKRQVIDLSKKEQMEPWFLEINPHHTVPTLHDKTNGVVLYESIAILEYLAEIFDYDGKYGLPKDIAAKYKTINALHKFHNFNAVANRDIMGGFYTSVFGGTPFDLEAFKNAVEKVKKAQFVTLDEIIGKQGGYITGPEPTLIDLRSWVDLFQLSNLAPNTLNIVDFSEFPNIQKWLIAIQTDLYTADKWPELVGFYTYANSLIGTDYRLAQPKK